jgi:hypothetical protein
MNAHHKEALAQPPFAPRLIDTQLRVVLPLPAGATINDGDAPRLTDNKPAVAITMSRAQWKEFAKACGTMMDDVDDMLIPPKPNTPAVKS